MIEYPDAGRLMAGQLGDWLSEQAVARGDAVRESGNRMFKAGIVLLPLFAFLWILVPFGLEPKLWITFGLGGLAWAWIQTPKTKARKRVKIGINEAIAEALGVTYSHTCRKTDAFKAKRRFKLLPAHDRAQFEDCWSGETAGHAFQLHEAHLQERRRSGKSSRWVTVFRGAIVSIGFADSFHGTTMLARNGQFRRFFGGAKDTIKADGTVLDRADMVSPEFEERFDVYTTDQTEARWLIHPEYVERVLEIERAFHGKGSTVLFTDNRIILAIEAEDMFESGSLDAAEDRARVAETISQFARIADLALSLNRVRPQAAA